MKKVCNRINPVSAVFGIILALAGMSWIGTSAGILPRDINIFKYLCPAVMVFFGLKIVFGSLTGNSADSSCGRERD